VGALELARAYQVAFAHRVAGRLKALPIIARDALAILDFSSMQRTPVCIDPDGAYPVTLIQADTPSMQSCH